MITEDLNYVYGKRFVHKETGRLARITDPKLFVKDGMHWVQCVAYSVEDCEAVFAVPVDSFRVKFEFAKEE